MSCAFTPSLKGVVVSMVDGEASDLAQLLLLSVPAQS
jgi:hypothetical protein